MTRWLILFLALAGATAAEAQDASGFGLERGPYAVGVRVVHQHDFSRTYGGLVDAVTGQIAPRQAGRPIQTVIWYPAVAGGEPMRLADYLRLSATEEAFEQSREDVDQATQRFIATRAGQVGGAEIVAARVARSMWATADAAPADGRFPVVIYAPSFGASAYENADLCEYLASQGYVVIASPSLGARSRPMTSDLAGLEAQVGDIGFLIGYARTLPQVDIDRVAVAGFSWGGMANVFASARDNRIDALISLDGSIRFFPKLAEDSGYVTPRTTTAPLLLFAAQSMALEDTPADLPNQTTSFVSRMVHADQYRVTMNLMNHGNFAALITDFAPESAFVDYSRAEVTAAYGWAARYTVRFLDAYLKDDAPARAFLGARPIDNGVPRHLMALNVRQAIPLPPTRETMAAELARRGFAAAPEVYAAMKARDAAFDIPEVDLNAWGYQLMALGRVDDAIAMFKLATTLHPESGNAYDSLAEGYASRGDRELAVANYRRSLALDPSNANAVARLAALGVATP